jgi:hypothetical protein
MNIRFGQSANGTDAVAHNNVVLFFSCHWSFVTSRAAIHRLLDPENTSVTLATLKRAARSLRKVKIELAPA